MKHQLKVTSLLAFFSVAVAYGCSGDEDSAPAAEEGDSAGDGDGDGKEPMTSGDGDGGGIGGDDGGDGDEPTPIEGPDIPSDLTATFVNLSEWVAADATPLGIQGSFYEYSDMNGSTISARSTWFEEPGKLCVSGEGAQVVDQLYHIYWGVGVGLDLCNSGQDGDPPNTTYTISDCPTAPDLHKTFRGVSFVIEGDIPSSILRVLFSEVGRDDSAYTEVRRTGRHISLVDSAEVSWQPDGGKPVDLTQIKAIQFQIPTTADGPTPFNFCISDFAILTGEERDIMTGTAGAPGLGGSSNP